jgi:hypothetical protein
MKLTKFGSDRTVYINAEAYRIDWDRKVSGPQKKVKDFLRQYWDGQSVYEEIPIPGSRKRIDLMNWTSMVVIEVSPAAVHTQFNKFMHKSHSGFLKTLQTDLKKMDWAEKNGFTFISLNDNQIKNLSKELLGSLGVDL